MMNRSVKASKCSDECQSRKQRRPAPFSRKSFFVVSCVLVMHIFIPVDAQTLAFFDRLRERFPRLPTWIQVRDFIRRNIFGNQELRIVARDGVPADAYPMQACQGDCQGNHSNCDFGMLCYSGTNDRVPGCFEGEGDGGGGIFGISTEDADFCYVARDSGELVLNGRDGQPRSAYPLSACRGECQSDADCIFGLECMIRNNTEPVPGCGGEGIPGTNYCFGTPSTYVPGKATVFENGLALSQGLTSRVIAITGEPVRYSRGGQSLQTFHTLPDGAAIFIDPNSPDPNKPRYKYVSNSETSGGGVGAIEFDSDGNVIGYERLLTGTASNCGGGKTFWNTWLSCEERSGGQVWEVNPYPRFGQSTSRMTVMGFGSYGYYESAAYDNRDPYLPQFYITSDEFSGPLVRFTPSTTSIDYAVKTGDYSQLLHDFVPQTSQSGNRDLLSDSDLNGRDLLLPPLPNGGDTDIDAITNVTDIISNKTASPTNKTTTQMPSKAPTTAPPTTNPTHAPTQSRTNSSSNIPTQAASSSPTTNSPTPVPTNSPTRTPTKAPTTPSPTLVPTSSPTKAPSTPSPTPVPTSSPTRTPTKAPTTSSPTPAPTSSPTERPPTPFRPARYEFLYLNWQAGTYTWTTDLTLGQQSASNYHRYCEGIDIRNGMLYMTCKTERQLFILDLDAQKFQVSSTLSGTFSSQPDQVARLLNGPGGVASDDPSMDILYFCEDGGSETGVHARDRTGKYFTILSATEESLFGETTGLAFGPGNYRMYVSFQQAGRIFEIKRRDGKPFGGQRLDIKYHGDETNTNPFGAPYP